MVGSTQVPPGTKSTDRNRDRSERNGEQEQGAVGNTYEIEQRL